MIKGHHVNDWKNEWYADPHRADLSYVEFLADKINSHLSELQAGNRERALRAIGLLPHTASFEQELDAILSVIIPGSSEEVERLKAELETLRSRALRWLPGDTVYRMKKDGSAIGEYKITMICRDVSTGKFCFALNNQGWYFCDTGASCSGEYGCYATAEECRASIPVEHLKGEQ